MLKLKSGSGRCFHTVTPDPDQDGALAMQDHAIFHVPPDSTSDPGAELRRRFGDRWQIQLEDLGVWSAVCKSPDGRHIRCIVGRTATELASKLETAETVEP
jgi:hypothetical protein